MTLRMRRPVLAAYAVALATALVACGGSGNEDDSRGGTGPTVQESVGQKGGVVKVLMQSDFEHLDPQRNYVNVAGNVGRLITRTLTVIKEEEGSDPEIVGDLAESWEPNDDNTSWTFTLKDGLKFQDGSPVTAQDVKYGVERSFSPDITSGAGYARALLAGTEGYEGPYVGGNNGGKGLGSIQTPDDRTVVFTLNRPVSDFPWTVSTMTFSPVQQAKDTKTLYDNDVQSTGPYKIDSYVPGQSMVLVRNEHWDKSTDELRTALPDAFEFTFGQDATVVNQRMLEGNPADSSTIALDVNVQNQSLGQLEDPDVAPRVVRGPSICVRYVAINMRKPAMQDVRVRQALQYAVNKRDFQTAYGGPLSGPVVDSMIPPSSVDYEELDLYEAPETGDQDKARQLLEEAGASDLAVTLATVDLERANAAAIAVQNALEQAGIDVTIQKIPGDDYYTTIENDASAPELMLGGWCPDWPSASAILPPLFGPDSLMNPTGPDPNNFSRYEDAENWAEMKRIGTEITDSAEAEQAWAALNEEIMKDAPLVPTTNDGGIFVVGSDLTDVTVSPTMGGFIDMVKVGVRQ